MKAFVAALLLAMAGPAYSGDLEPSCPVKWLPPKEFDHIPPVLPVEWDMDVWAVDAKCRKPTPYYAGDRENDGRRFYGCTRWWPGYTEIIVAKAGSDGVNEYCHELLVRHEWGHVNGWPSDHPDAVPVA